jgi:hypothetical protein
MSRLLFAAASCKADVSMRATRLARTERVQDTRRALWRKLRDPNTPPSECRRPWSSTRTGASLLSSDFLNSLLDFRRERLHRRRPRVIAALTRAGHDASAFHDEHTTLMAALRAANREGPACVGHGKLLPMIVQTRESDPFAITLLVPDAWGAPCGADQVGG